MYFVPCRMVNDVQLRNRSFSLCCCSIKLPSTLKCASWVDQTIVDAKMWVIPLRKVRNSDSGVTCGRHTGDGMTLL